MTPKLVLRKIKRSFAYQFCTCSPADGPRLGSENTLDRERMSVDNKTHFDNFKQLLWPIDTTDGKLVQ